MSGITDQQPTPKGSRKRAILAVVVLLLLVVVSELLTIAVRHTSSSFQKRGNEWAKLRCIDHNRIWVVEDKTETTEGSCH